MTIPRFLAGTLRAGLLVTTASAIFGQDYPGRHIRIVTSEAGGSNDFQVRVIAQGISALLGQQLVIDNRPSGFIPGTIVSKAPPNGYTLLVYNDTHWIGPLLENAPYEAVKDFSTITTVARTPNVIVVNSSLAAKSIKELIALAKARPGELNYASSGTGASNHLAAELFKTMAGVDMVRVSYRGGGPALTALIAGQVQLMFNTPGGVAPHVKSGKLRALAVTSAQPTALAPGLPTMAASGLTGYESGIIYGAWAPAKTPEAVIRRLNQEFVRVLSQADVKEKLFNAGADAVGSTPDEFAATVKSEISRMGKLIKDAGIRAN